MEREIVRETEGGRERERERRGEGFPTPIITLLVYSCPNYTLPLFR